MFDVAKAGNNGAANRAIMAMTTNNSISVKALGSALSAPAA